MASPDDFDALVRGRHHDPFALLGVHAHNGGRVVRTFQPQAREVNLVDTDGAVLARFERAHDDGLFVADMPPRKRRYRLRITTFDGSVYDIEDPYRFDVRRSPNEHLGFGGPGPHFCIGANLARREIKVMFSELFRRLPDLELTGEPERLASNFIHGIKRVHCEFTPRTA